MDFVQTTWESMSRHWRYVVAGGLFLASLASTVWLGVLGAGEEPVTRSAAGFLVLLAGGFQLSSAILVHSVGRADPGLARAAVRRLVRQAKRAAEAERLAQHVYETGNAGELRKAMGTLSVHLSYLEEGALEAIEDWQEFHGQALQQVTGGTGGDDG